MAAFSKTALLSYLLLLSCQCAWSSIEKSIGVRCADDAGYTWAKGTHLPKLTRYGGYLVRILRRHSAFQVLRIVAA